MKTLDIKAYTRGAFGKTTAKRLRLEGKLPCTLNTGKDAIQLYIDMAEVKDLIYTPEVCFINLQVKDKTHLCILTQQEFHPVSEMPYHLNFMHIVDEKKILMRIPIRPVGTSPGIAKGGILLKKLRRLRVHALPKDMPPHIQVDINRLDLGQTARVKHLATKNYSIKEDPGLPVVTITVPRSLRSQASEKK